MWIVWANAQREAGQRLELARAVVVSRALCKGRAKERPSCQCIGRVLQVPGGTYRVVVRERGSERRVVDLYDRENHHVARISDVGDEAWRCEWCQRLFRGGVCISAALTCCRWCLREIAQADPEKLLEEYTVRFTEGLASANRAVEGLDELVNLFPRWRFLSRRWVRRSALGAQRGLDDYTQYLRGPEGREGLANMIHESQELIAIVDEYF